VGDREMLKRPLRDRGLVGKTSDSLYRYFLVSETFIGNAFAWGVPLWLLQLDKRSERCDTASILRPFNGDWKKG
jgi:hypothetical protein